MAYIAQTIVFIIALMGVLFKSTKTDADGKTIYIKYGFPVLTRTGQIVVTLLTLSFVISLLTSWQQAKSDTKQKNDAKTRQTELNNQLNSVKQQNQGLRDGIAEIIKASSSLSKEQKISFASVLTEQKQTGDGIASRIATSAELLRGRVDSSIELLSHSAVELNRAANPINDMRVFFRAQAHLDHPAVTGYRRRLEKTIEEMLSSQIWDGIYVSKKTTDGKPLELGIYGNSYLFPNHNSESEYAAYWVLNAVGVKIDLYKIPVGVEALISGISKPDFSFTAYETVNSTTRSTGSAHLFYDLQRHQVSVTAINLVPNPEYMQNNHVHP